MNFFAGKSLKEWNVQDVKNWLVNAGYQSEADFFEESHISGKALHAMTREAMKDIGVNCVGKQLEIMGLINDIKEKESAVQKQDTNTGAGAVVQSKWKKKIGNSDKINWTAEQRALYNTKTALIIKNCRKVWPGNQKVLFKGNEKNILKLEEMVTNLVENCSIEEIGFGSEAIRNHIIQWGQEKNRRVSDGYDFEKEHKRAKRAKFMPWSNTSSSTTSTGSDDNDTDFGEQEEGDLSSNDIKDLSPFSAKIAILVAFNANSLGDISLKHHLIPLAKALKVKYRGKGKYDLIMTLATALFTNKFLEPSDKQTCNYVHLKRHDIKQMREIPSRSATTPATPSTTPPATPSTTPPATPSTTPPASQSTTPPASQSMTPPASQSTTPPASQSTTPTVASSKTSTAALFIPETDDESEGEFEL